MALAASSRASCWGRVTVPLFFQWIQRSKPGHDFFPIVCNPRRLSCTAALLPVVPASGPLHRA
jgi:hypothetical protein